MKLYFKDASPQHLANDIQNHIDNKTRYAGLVRVESRNSGFDVIIQKLGTSKLEFTQSGSGWDLKKEKIAFSHRPYKEKVHRIIEKIVLQLGGEVR